jgi:hypothetical protein
MSIYSNVSNHPTTFYFDSSERASGSNESFLSKPITIDTGNRYDSVVVSQVSIPKSWYNVPANFNTFTLYETDALGPMTTTTITIPIGNYNRINFASVLAGLLTTNSQFGKTYTISYPNVAISADTGKYTFAYTPANPGDLVIFEFNSTNMFQQMGFLQASTNTFDDASGTLESTKVINFQIVSSIFINSDMCVEEGVLQEIHSVGASPANSYIYFQQNDFDITSKQFLTNTSNSWTFNLIDEFERPVDLNNVAWALSVIFYNRSDYHQIAKEDLRIRNIEKLLKNEMELKK